MSETESFHGVFEGDSEVVLGRLGEYGSLARRLYVWDVKNGIWTLFGDVHSHLRYRIPAWFVLYSDGPTGPPPECLSWATVTVCTCIWVARPVSSYPERGSETVDNYLVRSRRLVRRMISLKRPSSTKEDAKEALRGLITEQRLGSCSKR